MSYENAEILRDKNNNPIPQYFNISTGKFEPVTGESGATHSQVTGSNVEDVFFERFIFNGVDNRYNYAFPPSDVRGGIVTVVIHGATGDYSDGDGFRPRLLNYALGSGSGSLATEIVTEFTKSDTGVYQFYVFPGIELKDADTRNSQNKFYVSHTFVPNFLALFLDLQGDIEDGEGYDISAQVMWLR